MRSGVWLALALALGVAADAAAREPVPPLTVRDGPQPWTVTARVDTGRFGAVTVSLHIFRQNHDTGVTELAHFPVDGQDGPFVVRPVSLQPQALADLADGAYSMAIVAEGEPRDPEAPLFRNQHLVHFKMEGGVPTPLTQAQYSALSDPVQVVEGPDGVLVRVHHGAVVPGPRPLPGPSSADALESINTAGLPGSTSEKLER